MSQLTDRLLKVVCIQCVRNPNLYNISLHLVFAVSFIINTALLINASYFLGKNWKKETWKNLATQVC